MSAVIQFNPSHLDVPGLVVGRRVFSDETSPWEGRPNVIVDPPGFTMAGGHYKWDGVAMVACNPTESAAVDAAQDQAEKASKKQALKSNVQSTDAALYHLLNALVEEVHAHVSLPTKNVSQLKLAILDNFRAKVDAME